MAIIQQQPGNYTMPKIPKQYWDSGESRPGSPITGQTVSGAYAKNKRMQITDYNAKLDLQRDRGIVMPDEKSVIEERNLLGDLDTKAGVYFEEDKKTYTVVGDKKYDDMTIESTDGDKEPVIVRFEDKSALGRLKDIFLGYSLKERRRDVKEIEDIEKHRYTESTSILPVSKREDPGKITEKVMSVSKWYQKPSSWLIGKSMETISVKREDEGKDTKVTPLDVLTYRKPKEKSIKERQYETIKAEGEELTGYDEGFQTNIEKLESSEAYKENVESRKQYDILQQKYIDKGFTGTSSDYGKWDEEGNIIEIGPAMPEQDVSQFLELSKKTSESYEILKPDITKLQTQEKELKRRSETYEARRKLFVDTYEEAEKSKIDIMKRDPFKATQMAIMEGLKSKDVSRLKKLRYGAEYGMLMMGKTLIRDPIQTLVTSPIDVMSEDIKEKRVGWREGLKTATMPVGKYASLVGRGIYDPHTESSFKFDPEALSGAVTVGTFGYGAIAGFTKTGVAGVKTAVAVKKGLTIGTAAKTGIYTLPVGIESVKYATSDPEERSGWQSYGRVMGSYGTLAGYLAAGYVGGKVGVGIKQSQIASYDLSKGLRSGEVKIHLYSKTEGKGFKEIKGVKNANEFARISDKGNVIMETPHGRFQIKTTGAAENIGSKAMIEKTSLRAPGHSEKLINLQVKRKIWEMYNKQAPLHDKVVNFDSFKGVLSSTHKGRLVTKVKTYYTKHSPAIKDELMLKPIKEGAFTPSGTMYGTGRIHMDIRPVDAMGRSLGPYKSFGEVNTYTFDMFYKNPSSFSKVVDAQGHIEKYGAMVRKGNTYTLYKDPKTGQHYYTPIRQRADFVVKPVDPDAGVHDVKKMLYYKSHVEVGKPVKISKDLHTRLGKELGDPTQLSKYLSKSQLEQTKLFYKIGPCKDSISFDQIQSVAILKSKPTNINMDKYYFIGKTKDWSFLKDGISKGEHLVKGSQLRTMTLEPNQVAFEVATAGHVKKVGVNYILTKHIGAHGIKSELGTPYKKFVGHTSMDIRGKGPEMFGEKGVAKEQAKFYGRPGTGMEVTDKSIKTMYGKTLVKTELKKEGIRMSSSAVDDAVKKGILTIDPATGKVAMSAADKAVLSAKYGGDWSNVKITAGPQKSSVESTIKVFREYDPKLNKYIDKIGIFDGKTQTTKYLGSGYIPWETREVPSYILGEGGSTAVHKGGSGIMGQSTVFEPSADAGLISRYVGYTGSVPKISSITEARQALSSASPSIISGIQTGHLTSVPGTGLIPSTLSNVGGATQVLIDAIPTSKVSYSSIPRTGIESRSIPDVADISEISTDTEPKSVVRTEVTPETAPVEVYESTSVQATEVVPAQTTAIETVPVGDVIPVSIPTPAPPGLPGITGFVPALVWPRLGFPIGSSRATPKRGKYTGKAKLDPMADWRIYFKRKFGYYGMPGTTKKVEIYNPSYKDYSDVGNVMDRVKELSSIK